MSDNKFTESSIEANEEFLHFVGMTQRGQLDLDSIDGESFVLLVGFVISKFGWEIQVGHHPNDLGYDLVGQYKNPLGFASSTAILCKHQKKNRPVDLSVVKLLYSTRIKSGFQNAMVVTNSHFTKGSMEFADSKQDLQLIDRDSLSSWLSKIPIDSIETGQAEVEGVANPNRIRQLVSILQETCNSTVSAAESERVISRMFAMLTNSELISATQLNQHDSTPRAAAIAAVFLASELPKNDSSKIAIWNICSQLLLEEFALLPSELEEFYRIACSDSVSAPSYTLEWIWAHLQHLSNLNRLPR